MLLSPQLTVNSKMHIKIIYFYIMFKVIIISVNTVVIM